MKKNKTEKLDPKNNQNPIAQDNDDDPAAEALDFMAAKSSRPSNPNHQ